MYPTPMYRAAISRTALPTALAGMTPPVCAARAGVGVGAVGSAAGTVECSTGVAATAAPLSSETRRPEVPAVDTSALTATARIALTTAPVVQVPAGATWTFDTVAITVTADPPPP